MTVGAERNETIRGCHEMQRRDKHQWKLMALKPSTHLTK